MKLNSIKSKLLILLLISISSCFLILGFYNTYNAYNSKHSLVEQKELNLSKQTSKFINSYLQSKIDIVSAVKNGIPLSDLNVNNKNIISALLLGKHAGKFVDVYIGFESTGDFLLSNGSYLSISKDNFDARLRPWYKQAIRMNKAGITKPYVDVSTKKLVVTVFVPFIKNGKTLGVVGSDIFLDTVVDTILNVDVGNEGFAYLLDENAYTLIHKNKDLINKKNLLFQTITSDKKHSFQEIEFQNKNKLISYSKIPVTSWFLVIELDKDKAFEDINSDIITEVLIYIVLLAVILLFLYISLVKILAPLASLENGLNSFFRYLKGEEQSIKLLNIDTNDEFGNMAKVIDSEMKIVEHSLNQDRLLIDDVKNVVNHVKSGKLDLFVNANSSTNSLNELKHILNDMIEILAKNVDKDINHILASLDEYSKLNFVNNIDGASGNISKGLNNLSNIINTMLQENQKNGLSLDKSSQILLENVDILNKASNDTAVSLEETAAALEEITESVISNTGKIQEMSKYSNDLSSSINKGQNLATSTVNSMNEINEQTQSIADAITVIDQIAFQTNILSLNAAVEAATAGEAGKGFAVVAQEVRNLASRSAEAAKEIKDLVEAATTKTNIGKKIADEMIQGYSKLNENISKTTEIIKTIETSSNEQRTSIEQINNVVNKLDQQTQNNAQVASKTHDIALDTSDIAKQILHTVNQKEFRDKNTQQLSSSSDTRSATKRSVPAPSKIERQTKQREVKKTSTASSTYQDTTKDEWESF
ncbi:MAG: methyl-accepting chemotaxis protein [Campylobacteraceae bacterium]|nr:methyl-accepting chemotaxis protein [Campylobacteraceae bacterium]